MYITTSEVIGNIRGLSNKGHFNDARLQTFIDSGAAEINNRLSSIYEMPIPDAPTEEGAVDKYASARESLKTLLLYYCMVRIELFAELKPNEASMMQAITNRKAYEKLYMDKLDNILTMTESLPGVDVRQLVEYNFPESRYNDYDEGPNW